MRRKGERGFSVILVSSLGLIMVMMALAVTASLVPVYKNIGTQNTSSQSDLAAEVGVQYAIAKLNTADANFLSRSSIPLTVPPQITNGIANGATVSVTISSFSPGTDSPLYDPLVVNFGKSALNGNDYRQVTSNAVVGGAKSTIVATIRTRQAQSGASLDQTKTPPTNGQYFNNALFANATMSFDGSGTRSILTENSSSQRQAKVASNSLISFSGRNFIDGDVVANRASSGPSVTGSPFTRIYGNLTNNGVMPQSTTGSGRDAFLPDTPENIALNYRPNVWGDSIQGATVGAISSAGNAQATSAPSFQAPPTTAADFSSSNMTVTAPAQTDVADLGAVVLSGSQVLTLPAGNYSATSLNISGQAKIVTKPSTNGSTVTISVQGQGADSSSDTGSAITIDGGGIQQQGSGPASASNVQIYYNGKQNVSLNLNTSLYALVYAPGADVTMNLNGQQFHGAVSSNNMTVNGSGTIYFDPASIVPASPSASNPSAFYTDRRRYFLADTSRPTFYILSWTEL